ncbi:MAG: hypothetical protein ACT4P4_21540, partial [Betaproteobacteria bacterium]
GRPLGNTEFSSMHAAYEDLSQEIKQKLAGMTVLHDFNKFWEMNDGQVRAKLRPVLGCAGGQ